MSNKNHTPGPWTQGYSESGKVCVFLDGKTEPDKELGDANTWIDCNTEANASLVAAAPDLLDALQKLVNIVAEHQKYNCYDFASVEVEVARAAIAKATVKKG